jgi:hypothetical protein
MEHFDSKPPIAKYPNVVATGKSSAVVPDSEIQTINFQLVSVKFVVIQMKQLVSVRDIIGFGRLKLVVMVDKVVALGITDSGLLELVVLAHEVVKPSTTDSGQLEQKVKGY